MSYIRFAKLDDISSIAMIEKLVQPDPWSFAILEMSLMTDDQYWVSVPDSSENIEVSPNDMLDKNIPVYGFIIASTCAPQVNLTNFAVHPHMQKKGIGQQLFNHLLSTLVLQKIKELTLEVRISNQVALQFYEKNGFVVTHRRKNYYRLADNRTHEDALMMSRFF